MKKKVSTKEMIIGLTAFIAVIGIGFIGRMVRYTTIIAFLVKVFHIS